MTLSTDSQFTRTELHRGMSHQVFRIVTQQDGAVIVKQAIDDGASISRLRHEQEILARLQGVTGCPSLVRYDPANRKLVMADFGGVTLSQSHLAGRMNIEQFLSLSEALALIVAAIHARGVIHKDLNPGNILVRLDDLQPQVIDFDLATTFAKEMPGFEHPVHMQGTPAYMSPEQTGRMNRPVDYRADLYSLGATLYELATGVPQFEETDTLSLMHAHLARSPRPPFEMAPWLPQRLSELILTLLAKEPDDRYQSAAGLAFDIRRLRDALGNHESLEQVQLRLNDIPLAPRLPHRLYGRDRELETLLGAFASVTQGGSQNLFVAGYAGIGKTALINEIHRPVTLGRGLFVSGKFDQFQRNRPFLAPAQSLNQLCQLLLSESEEVAAQWRERILAGLGQDAGALFGAVPDLELLLGPQPDAPELGPHETQIRLRSLLVAFVRQVAAPDHPLVLFLDDLQWADQPSLEFVSALLGETFLNGLLLIGAYRDNEVDASHPLYRLLQQPVFSGEPVHLLTLSNLSVDQIAFLLADMLHMPPDIVQTLAAALHAKTSGNPFFTVEFLNLLYREGVLYLDLPQGTWSWDIEAIFSHPASANVVDFLTAQLAVLASDTAGALTVAACLGNECQLGRLALASGAVPGDLVGWLTPALERGILDTPNTLAFNQAEVNVRLRFCHDRMQQAAYHLCDDGARAKLHLSIARRLFQAGIDPADPFSVAGHYAAAAQLIVETDEQALARALFLKAAIQSNHVGAFTAAERLLRLGMSLLATDAWTTAFDESFAFNTELHLTLYRQARFSEADEVYARLEARTEAPERLVEATCLQMKSLAARTEYDAAVRLGSVLLERLGVTVPLADPSVSLSLDMEQLYRIAESETETFLPDRMAPSDPRLIGTVRLLESVASAASHSQPLITGWVSARFALQWTETGYLNDYLTMITALIITTIALRGDFHLGYRVAQRALAMGLAHEHGNQTAIVQHLYAIFVNHWFNPLETTLGYARAAFNGLLRCGDLDYACMSLVSPMTVVFETGAQLTQIQPEVAAALTFARKTGNRHAEQIYLPYQQVAHTLEGGAISSGSFDDDDFREQDFLEATQGNPQAGCMFHVFRALSAAIYQDDVTLIREAEAAVNLTPYVLGVYITVQANALHSLALIQQIRTASESGRSALRECLERNQAWLAARAADAPMNFGHLHEWIAAEYLDAFDQPWEALQGFEQSMRHAQGNQRPWHYALITERAGQAYARRGLEQASRYLLSRACQLYQQWGAIGKVRAMQRALHFLEVNLFRSSTSSQGDSMDHEALLRASQTLASEISKPRLVARVVELVGQLTGATDTRLLLLDENDQWQLEGGVRDQELLDHIPLADARERRLVAASVLQLGLKTMKPIVSDDAAVDSRFAGDPHFAGMPMCSLLAVPVLARGRVIAFLTLENRLARAAFTESRVEMISLLCRQLAVSLENTQLYQSLERKVAERTAALSTANDQLQQLSERDGLTNVANRRKFDAAYEMEWRRGVRTRQSLAILMIDIDRFKLYNDHYGHQVGDRCLQTVAAVIQASAQRSGELVARYGGEEFVAILPGLNTQSASEVAEKMRATVEAQLLEHACNTPSLVVTISVGVAACIPEKADHPGGLIAQADACLYRAKNSGRNQVIWQLDC